MQCGQQKQRGATLLGMLTIIAILGCGLYAGIRLLPLYMENMAVSRALKQTAATAGGDLSPSALRGSLGRRWTVEDIKSISPNEVEIKKVGSGTVELLAEYRAEAPFIANVSLVVDFRNSAMIGGGGSRGD
jgi:hypothetical protein